MLKDGLYSLTIERSYSRKRKCLAFAEALAVLRNGAILGSGPMGGTFTGTYSVDTAGQDTIKLHLNLPPGRELLNGFKAGRNGARIDIEAAMKRANDCHRAHRAQIQIGGKALEITAAFVGPLPA